MGPEGSYVLSWGNNKCTSLQRGKRAADDLSDIADKPLEPPSPATHMQYVRMLSIEQLWNSGALAEWITFIVISMTQALVSCSVCLNHVQLTDFTTAGQLAIDQLEQDTP